MKKTAVLIFLIPLLLFSIIFVRIYSGLMPVLTAPSHRNAVHADAAGTKDKVQSTGNINSINRAAEPERFSNKMIEDSLINEVTTPPLKFYSAEN